MFETEVSPGGEVRVPRCSPARWWGQAGLQLASGATLVPGVSGWSRVRPQLKGILPRGERRRHPPPSDAARHLEPELQGHRRVAPVHRAGGAGLLRRVRARHGPDEQCARHGRRHARGGPGTGQAQRERHTPRTSGRPRDASSSSSGAANPTPPLTIARTTNGPMSNYSPARLLCTRPDMSGGCGRQLTVSTLSPSACASLRLSRWLRAC